SEANIIEKSGAWFSFQGERIGQGRENAKQFLLEHPDIYNTIEAKVLAHHNIRRIGIDVAPEPAAPASPAASEDKAAKSGRAAARPAGASSAPPPSAPANGKLQGPAGSGSAPPPSASSNGKRPNA